MIILIVNSASVGSEEKSDNILEKCCYVVPVFKGTVARDFVVPFLFWIDSSGPKNDPLLVFKFFWSHHQCLVAIFIFRGGSEQKYWIPLEYPIQIYKFSNFVIGPFLSPRNGSKVWEYIGDSFTNWKNPPNWLNCLQDNFISLLMCLQYNFRTSWRHGDQSCKLLDIPQISNMSWY